MSIFRVTITVHKDYVVDVEAATKDEAANIVYDNMSEYTSGAPESYSYSEITDMELM